MKTITEFNILPDRRVEQKDTFPPHSIPNCGNRASRHDYSKPKLIIEVPLDPQPLPGMNNPTPEQLDKELAEKVAKKLGWKQYELGWMMCCGDSIMKGDLQGFILSWPTVGLAIEDARERGWELYYRLREVEFVQSENFGNITERFSAKEHGDIKAILLAYVEVPDK